MKTLLLFLVRGYRRFVSPLTPRCCRYYPTCSAYAMQALGRYGAARGSILTASRLLRCHPWARGGYDPIPAGFTWKHLPVYFWQNQRPQDAEHILPED